MNIENKRWYVKIVGGTQQALPYTEPLLGGILDSKQLDILTNLINQQINYEQQKHNYNVQWL
jgi:hypothetical protein